jgi:drug/metabolite transporter (DMT)-like permease
MLLRPVDFLYLASFPTLMTVGQLLFKRCAIADPGASLAKLLPLLMRMPVFYLTLGLYGVSTLLWIWLIGRYTLSIAYPFAAMAVVFVPLLEVFIYKQKLAPAYWVGLLLVIAGILIIVRSKG